MFRVFIRKNITSMAIVLFLALFLIIQAMKPSFIYNADGRFRHFGIGYKNKTVIYLVSNNFSNILSYVFFLYYITLPI